MTPDKIIIDVEAAAAELARLGTEVERLVGLLDATQMQLADAHLQLADVRSERDQEHQLADDARIQRDREHRFVESLKAALANAAALQESLNAAVARNAAIPQAIGIISEKAGISIPAAEGKLKSYSRGHSEQMRAIAAQIVAAQDPKSPSYGDPEIAHMLASAGIPVEFWNALTLNGAIFE